MAAAQIQPYIPAHPSQTRAPICVLLRTKLRIRALREAEGREKTHVGRWQAVLVSASANHRFPTLRRCAWQLRHLGQIRRAA
jgi:hypothetical protein